MEIKDVNNQNSVLAMFRKMTETAGTFEFASLIGGNEQPLVTASTKQVAPTMDKKLPETVETTDKIASRRDNKPVAEKSDNKPLKENKRKDKNIAEESAAPVAQEKTQVADNKSVSATDNTVPAEAKPTNVVSETVAEPIVEQGATMVSENIAVTAPVIADLMPEMSLDVAPLTDNFMDENNDALTSLIGMVSLDNIATLGEVKYYDAVNGTTITTTGPELVQAVEQNQISNFNPANITTLADEPVFPQLAEVSSLSDVVSEGGIDISMMEAVAPQVVSDMAEVVAAPTADVVADVETEEEFIPDVQAKNKAKTVGTGSVDTEAALDVEEDVVTLSAEEEIVINDKNVKLDVKIAPKEEKISYLSRQEMFADNLAVNEAVAKAVNLEAENTNSPINAVASQNSPITTAQSANILPQGVVVQAPVENLTSVTSGAAVSGVDGISNLTSASLNNSLAAQTKTAAPATELKSPAEDALKGMSKEVIEQVKVNITKSAVKGVDKIDISLKPEDLGHIEIKMQLSKDGKLQAHVISSRMETMEILQKDMQSLQKAFADAGFYLDENSLSFSFQDNNQAWQQQKEENGLRSFMGKLFENEGENDNFSQAETAWDGKSALNIRV